MAGIRLSRASFAPIAAVFAFVCIAGDAHAAGGDLFVTFNRDHSISFLTASGTFIGTTSGAPTQIPSGSYNFHFDNTVGVSCPSFTIRGPGTNFTENLTCGEYPSTTLAAVLPPNTTYTWINDEVPSVVYTFQTTSASVGIQSGAGGTGGRTSNGGSTSSSDIAGSGKVPFRGSLDGIVYKSGKLTLARNGKTVKSLKTGRWTFSVDDESNKTGFSIQVLHGTAKAITSKAYVGNHDVTVTLKPGAWIFFTPGSKTKTTFYVTS